MGRSFGGDGRDGNTGGAGAAFGRLQHHRLCNGAIGRPVPQGGGQKLQVDPWNHEKGLHVAVGGRRIGG